MSLSVFAKLPVPAVELEHPLHYAESAVSAAKLREPSVSGELISRLHRHLLNLKLNPKYVDQLNICDFVAKAFALGVSSHPSSSQNRLWLFASTLVILLFEFDDHFDKPSHFKLETIARLSKEMRVVLRSLSRHNLSGLQGDLEDWPAEVPCREAYLWLLREAEDLREGAAEVVHDEFVDYCYGVEVEVIDWQLDMYRGDLTAWNVDRYKELRKRSSGVVFGLIGPLFVAYKWIQKEHIIACTDLLYEASLVTSFGNDILGMKRDHGDSGVIDLTLLKIVPSRNKVAEHHNEMVKILHKKVLELAGDTRHFMEEVEASVAGLFLWQCHSHRYGVALEA